MKKSLCISLAFLMIICIFSPSIALANNSSNNSTEAKGSAYTRLPKLASVLDEIFAGDIDIYSDGKCTTEVNMPVNSTIDENKTYYVKSKTTGINMPGGQCYIYANAVYNKLFYETVVHGTSFSHSDVVFKGGDRVSFDQFDKAGVKCGAYMRTTINKDCSYNGGNGHSLIILAYDENSITSLEGNVDGHHIRIRKQTWYDFNKNNLYGRSPKRYVSHIVQPIKDKYNELYHECTDHNVDYTLHNEEAHPHAEYKLCYCGSKIYTGKHKKQDNCSYCKKSFLYTFNTVDGETVSTYSKDYNVTVSIFSNPSCGNSHNLIQSIIDNPARIKKSVQILYVDVAKNTKQKITALKNSFGKSNIKFCYDLSNNANNALWDYAAAAGFGNSITTPLIVFTKSDGTVFKILQGDVDPDYFFQLANIDLSQDMCVNLSVSGSENYSYANNVLKKLNEIRKQLNLQPLVMDENLLYAAMQRAAEISIYYSHTRPNGTSCFTVLDDLGKKAENIAIGQSSPTKVINDWANSPGHYANMTNANFKSVGIGCFINSNNTFCWVQVFSSSSPTEVVKTGSQSVTRVVNANAAHLSLSVYADTDPHKLNIGDSTQFRIENTNKRFNNAVQRLNALEFSFITNNNVISVDPNGYCTANETGKVTLTVEHRQSESIKTNGLYNVGHKYKTTIKKATFTKNGSIIKKCTVCGYIETNRTIRHPNTFQLSTKSYTYNGKVKSPSITVKNTKGTKLTKNKHYTVTYSKGRKNVGTYKVIVKGKGNYSGTKTLTFKINPAKTNITNVTSGEKKISVTIEKKSKQVTGYIIQYSTSKKFAKYKTKNKVLSSYKTTKHTLKGLKSNKTYYVRVRTYKTVGKKKYYSGWSKYKYVKTK